jgi:hypothetical protein
MNDYHFNYITKLKMTKHYEEGAKVQVVPWEEVLYLQPC